MSHDPRSSAEAPRPPDRLHVSMQALFVSVLVVLLAVLAGALWLHRQEALRDGQRRAENLALVLGDHLARTVGAVDAALSQLAIYSGRVGGPNASADAWAPVIEAARSGISGIAALSVLDSAGTVVHSTMSGLIGESRADFRLFQQLSREPAPGLMLDVPFRGRLTGQWVIPIARRLQAPDGSFAGVVIAALEPKRMRGFYRTIDVGRDGIIWVSHLSGPIVLREPPLDDAEQAARVNPLLAEQATQSFGFQRTPLTPGGPVYLSAYRRINGPPLVVTVSLAQQEMLAEWWGDTIIAGIVAACFAILLQFAWIVIAREMKARERSDAALRTNQALFQSIMDHAPLMVALRDLSGRFTFINRAYVTFAGQSEESILGRTVAELRSRQTAEKAAAQDRAVIETGKSAQWEMTLPKPNGPRTVLLAKFPVYDDAGKPNAVGTILTDITDQKHSEMQLAQAQRMNAIGQLTGGIAHDFNNLLTALLLNADVLVRRIDDDRLRPTAEAIRMAAERGADLIRRLLAFGRRQMLEPRPTDIRDLLDGMESLMHRTLGEHIEVELRHAQDLWTANVDPNQLENAVLNLAVNARDAMPDGGKLTIESANATFDADATAVNPEVTPGDYVMVAVHDTGIGMSPEILTRAFEPFFTTKEVGRGTGLGLSMVYGFVKQSGGHARIYSEVGLGTVVRLYLPRSDVAAVAPGIASPAAGEPASGAETILFVEDDPLVRNYTQEQLAELGYRVVTAENGAVALAHVEEGCVPDLLFTDMVMPGGVNGRELARQLHLRWPNLPVLYCSGYAHDALALDGEAVPARHLLGKPYRRRELAAKLRELLDAPLVASE